MIWGDDSVDISKRCEYANRKGYKYMLSYNEPDLKGESNKQPDTMRYRWNEMIDSKGSLRLGSPATETFQINSDKWWTPFWNGLNQTQKNNMTFIAVHAYQHYYDNADTALEYLHTIDEIYAKYKKPIWITEFAVSGWGYSNASNRKQVEAFLKTAIEGLNKRSYVERYSWFSFNTTDNSNGASALWTNSTGKLTDLGNIYVNNGNPTELAAQGSAVNKYQPSSDNGSNNSSNNNTNNQPQVKKPARAKISKLKNVKGRKVKVSIKKIKKVKGYQIKYSDNKKFNGYWQKNSKKNTYTVKKLDKKTKYYFKVRAYVINGNKKLYGSYSKVKSITVKR